MLDVNLFYDMGSTWMNLDLYDEYENILSYENAEGDHLHLTWTNDNYGKFVYIKVSGPNNGDWYDLELILNGQTGDDWAEENDFFDDARHLDFGEYNDMIQADDDWYEFWMEQNDQLEINLFYDMGATWMNLELYDQYQSLVSTGNQEGDHLYINWTNYDPGRSVYIKVSGPNNGDWYDIETILNGQAGDDKFEPNNNWNSAWYLNPGYYSQLMNYDDDYYRIHLVEGDKAIITVKCDYNAHLWLEEISENDGSTLYTDSSTNDGVLEIEINADHEYEAVFAVKGNNFGDWYDLDIKIENGANGKSGDDSSDPFADFDLSSIPGFPIEYIGVIFLISTISIVFLTKRKAH